jgi:sugar/nucleoside kinase (ribokinase family)
MDGENYHLHIFPHSVVERTGAGDAYASGFLAAVVTGESIPNAMRYGSVNASSVIGKIGAQEGLLKKQEMKKLLENHTDFMPDGL